MSSVDRDPGGFRLGVCLVGYVALLLCLGMGITAADDLAAIRSYAGLSAFVVVTAAAAVAYRWLLK
jgi:hypothetical protein